MRGGPVGCRAFALLDCCVAPLVFRAPEGPAAREIATREPAARSGRSRSPPVPSGPSGTLHTGGACGSGVPGQAPPPPTGTAAGPFGALHSSGARSLRSGLARCLEARPGPAALRISHAIPSDVFHGLKCDRWNSADSALVWGRAELELHAKLRCGVSLLWSSLLLRGIALLG